MQKKISSLNAINSNKQLKLTPQLCVGLRVCDLSVARDRNLIKVG